MQLDHMVVGNVSGVVLVMFQAKVFLFNLVCSIWFRELSCLFESHGAPDSLNNSSQSMWVLSGQIFSDTIIYTWCLLVSLKSIN